MTGLQALLELPALSGLPVTALPGTALPAAALPGTALPGTALLGTVLPGMTAFSAAADPPSMSDPEAWSDFAVAAAGAAAALAGLLFVALSINLTAVLASERSTSRAASALVMLASPVFLSLTLLVPWGSPTPLGVVLLVLGVLVSVALALLLPRPVAEVPVPAWLVSTLLPPLVLGVGTILAAIGVLTGGLGGLIWIAPAIGFALFGGLVGAWVLLVEILR